MENNFNTNIGTSLETTHTIDLSNRFLAVIGVLILGLVVSYVGSLMYDFYNLPQNYPQQIDVSGEGKAYVKPDIALASFGMQTNGLKSQDVVDRNNTVINQVIASVKTLGILDKDIQTTSYNLSPVYDYTEKGRVFKGYELNQQISVKIRDFDKISDILDVAVSKGANTVGDLQFTVDDPVKSQAEARTKAIAQAKEKAVSLARESGLKIDKLINISEGYSSNPEPMYARNNSLTDKAVSVAPQIQAGQMEVDSTVTLTYLLK